MTDENTLKRPGLIQLPGNPLALSIVPKGESPPKIVAAIDPGAGAEAETQTSSSGSLNLFSLTMSDGRLAVDAASQAQEDAVNSPDLEVTAQEIRNLLYGAEHLRKQMGGGVGEGEADEAGEA